MTAEKAEQTAQALMAFADHVGQINNLVRELCRPGECEQVREEPGSVDTLTGREMQAVAAAARSLAMRIDRAALVKFDGQTQAETV